MFPAYIIRAGVDWVRHNDELQESNPYSRCEEAVAYCQKLWQEEMGLGDLQLVEPATIIQYWAEFFHANDPSADEIEWREGLLKRSAQYDSFEEWQDWFKKNYKDVYKEDMYWTGVLTTSWAHTHQYEVRYNEDSWEFHTATPYLQSDEFWTFSKHMKAAARILAGVWEEELELFRKAGFSIEEKPLAYLGKPECLGYDTSEYLVVYPPRANRDKEVISVGEMVADIVLPPGDDWYRRLDNVIFAHDHLDATTLISRARYVFDSRRRLFELTADGDPESARMQAAAEGWLIMEEQLV